MKNISRHFSRIAPQYRNLRITDLEPIQCIANELQALTKIEAADIGCGTGRYDLSLFQHIGERLHMHCIDSNAEMLEQLCNFLQDNNINSFQAQIASADNIPLDDDSMNAIFSFNSIHHFDILNFLNESHRVLKNNGYIFIYTRLKKQNKRSIWGEHFPDFHEKETRLYDLDELENFIDNSHDLYISFIKYFMYKRKSNLENIVNQARNFHYSTFYLYTEEEFKKSLDQFAQNIRENFDDLGNIRWYDENILLVIRKRALYDNCSDA